MLHQNGFNQPSLPDVKAAENQALNFVVYVHPVERRVKVAFFKLTNERDNHATFIAKHGIADGALTSGVILFKDGKWLSDEDRFTEFDNGSGRMKMDTERVLEAANLHFPAPKSITQTMADAKKANVKEETRFTFIAPKPENTI